MTAKPGREVWHRATAAIALAGLAWSLVGSALSAGGHVLHQCAPDATAAATPVVQAGPHGDCGHVELGACEAALACTSLPSGALMGQGILAADAPPQLRAVVFSVATADDLFRGGPPTPPPNS